MRAPSVLTGFACLALPVAAAAAPVGAFDLPRLIAGADTIVSGRIEAASSGPGGERLAVIAPDRWLKGAPQGAQALRVTLRANGTPLARREYGTFYLTRQPGQSYEAADPAHLLTPAVPHPQAALPDPSRAVAAELLAVLQASPADLASAALGPNDPARSAEIAGAPRPLEGAAARRNDLYARTIEALSLLPAALSHDGLLAAAAGPDRLVQFWANVGLVRQNDWSGLPALSAALAAPALAETWPAGALALAIQTSPVSPDRIPMLRDLLRSQDVALRRAAASGLRDAGTPAAARPLATLALRDADARVRYYAVTGLAMATGSGDVPSLDAFAGEEARYLAVWSDWAARTYPQ
jgi:hypothetical protein